MEGLYIKVEEQGQVVERYKFIRADFLTTMLDSGSHWLRRPIVPNQLGAGVDLFGGRHERPALRLCPQPPSWTWTGQALNERSPGFAAWPAARRTRSTTPRATSGSTRGWCAKPWPGAGLAGLAGRRARRVFAAALLHDVAKPACTRTDPDGRITSRGHSRRGSILARQILWRLGVPFALREQVAALVRHHQVPYYLVDRADARRLAIEVSQTARCDHLAILAEADVRGRICPDQQRLLDNVALFVEFCREEDCLSAPRLPSDHARFLYFRSAQRHPDVPAHEDFVPRSC